MPKYVVDYYLDGYDTEQEHDAACLEHMKEQLDCLNITPLSDISEKFYQIRHKPTGLFYTPTKGRWVGEKTNLQERGKVYKIKPRLKGDMSCCVSDAVIKRNKLEDHCTRTNVYSKASTQAHAKNVSVDDFEIITFYIVAAE